MSSTSSTNIQTLGVTTRNYEPKSDRNFILNSWIHNGYKDRSCVIQNRIYDKVYKSDIGNYEQMVKDILAHPKTGVLVMTSYDNTNDIYGYVVYRYLDAVPVIHYIYVKAVFRDAGIGKYLFDKVCCGQIPIVTEVSRDNRYRDLLESGKIVYNPYIMFHAGAVGGV